MLVLSQVANAQPGRQATIITNARIVTMDGPVIESGTIVISGNRILSIGSDVTLPNQAIVLDAAGKTVTPGFIDAWSSLGMAGRTTGGSDPTARASDGFDPYSKDDLRAALAQGVTSIYLPPGKRTGVSGIGAVFQLAPSRFLTIGSVLQGDAALSVGLGSNQGAIARLRLLDGIRKQFRAALDYRRSLENYETSLAEYLKKQDSSSPPQRAPENRQNRRGGRRGRGGRAAEAQAEEEQGAFQPRPRGGRGQRGRGARGRGSRGGGTGRPQAGGKPRKPKPDRKSEVILRAIDNEIPVRIEAHRSADILNAIDLATEFGLSIIIEGGTEAHLVADQLAEHRIPVILGPGGLPGVYQNNQYRRHSPQAADILSRAGVSFTISSAASGAQASANVALSAQLAISHGQGAGDWMRAVTSDAAKVLGLSGTIGTLAPGTQADLVIWNGDPGAPDARIEWVYVRGRPIYSALAPNGQEED